MVEPLKLDWDELLAGDDATPSQEVEVRVGFEGEVGNEGFPLMSLSDHLLQEKIDGLFGTISNIKRARLPDGGKKLWVRLQRMEDEKLRRELIREKNKKACGETRNSMEFNRKPSAERALDDSCSEPSVSFRDVFFEKTGAACNNGSRSTRKEECVGQKKVILQLHEGGKPSQISSSQDKLSSKPSKLSPKNKTYKDNQGLGVRGFYGSRSTKKVDCAGQKKVNIPLHELGNPSQILSSQDKLSSKPSKLSPKHESSKDNQGLGARDFCGPSFTSYVGGGNACSNFSKRKQGSLEGSNSSDFQWVKSKHLVYLDEDDEDTEDDCSMRQMQHCSDEWKKAKIYYPSRSDPEAVELSSLDIECLSPKSYLSSPIMNFYIRHLQADALLDMPNGEHYFFNTFFYQKLEEAISSKDNREHFLRLRRWWKGVNIFRKAYIFLPIHAGLHWSLVVICFPVKEDESGPLILHLDSLGIHSSTPIFHVASSYLKLEWECLREDELLPDFPISKKIWKALPRRIQELNVKVPQQKNDYDCGLFVLYYMERFIKDYPQRLRKKDLDKLGNKWFRPEDASNLRPRIQNLLISEFKKANATTTNQQASQPASNSSSTGDDIEECNQIPVNIAF